MYGFAFGLEEEIKKLDKEYKSVIHGFYIGMVKNKIFLFAINIKGISNRT